MWADSNPYFLPKNDGESIRVTIDQLKQSGDIELNATPNGKSYIMFTIACDNGKDENGEKRDADFVNCVAWGKRAETISEYVKKGNRFSVVGSFKTDKYETSSGETRYRSYCLVSEFEFLESKRLAFTVSCEI